MGFYFLGIILIVAVLYGIIPILGAFINRYKWRLFRNRFNELRQCPLLNYRLYCQLDNENKNFRFTGALESITDGHTLWVRGEDLTIPISLSSTKCFLLPKHEGEGMPEAPEEIHWNRISTLTEGAKVFIGGYVEIKENRLNFISTKDSPLMVIFYSCQDSELADNIIRSARSRGEYWNGVTPISLATGVLALIYIAASYVGRPAFRLVVISSIIAVFVPILPFLPPGFILTIPYRRLTQAARKLRADHDLARFGLLQGSSEKTAKQYAIRAYTLETLAWIILLSGICINIYFIYLVLIFFQVISF
jgi:hypothetical protein